MTLVVGFLWSETLFYGPIGFTYVLSCALHLSTQKAINTSHLLGSIFIRTVTPMFTPFKLQGN